jgi:hypothetical protein
MAPVFNSCSAYDLGGEIRRFRRNAVGEQVKQGRQVLGVLTFGEIKSLGQLLLP